MEIISVIFKWIIILYLLLMVWAWFWASNKDGTKTSKTKKIIGILITLLILTYNIPYLKETYTDSVTIIKTEYEPMHTYTTYSKGRRRRRVHSPNYYTVIEYKGARTKVDNRELYNECKNDIGQRKRLKISEGHYLIWGTRYNFKIIK